jgi:hypothetical protein
MDNKILDRMEDVFGPQKTFKCLALGLIGICIGAIFFPNDPKIPQIEMPQINENNKEEN